MYLFSLARPKLPPGLRRVALLPALARMRAARRQRRHLLMLDPHLLADIGLDRASAEREAARPAWDVPRHWRQ
ncbi:DUF1127 domain-containing protein [Frigidibacter oleivorans]|uniref:DUF1127 domain-containing protein n=1 Tax=Frigidibacter oleivorans TaxID=2487129 RepID=UPI000F8CC9A6|nr:DUF1127 domain-containing protein [Frigidibacter oleivorans]